MWESLIKILLLLTSDSPEQILALRTEADAADAINDDDSPANSPDLGPPPMSKFIQQDVPQDVQLQLTPSKSTPKKATASPKGILQPPELLPSPKPDRQVDQSPSPQKRRDPQPQKKLHPKADNLKLSEPQKEVTPHASPAKNLKRKLGARDEVTQNRSVSKTNENELPKALAGKPREKADRKPLGDLATRKEERTAMTASRKPLSSKSTNDDICSPKKKTKHAANDEILSAKAGLDKPKAGRGRPKSKSTAPRPPLVEIKPEPEPESEPAPAVATIEPDLGTPLAEPELLAPNSPLSAPPEDASRGDTPPPADISAAGETARGGRRSRGAVVSYAEPNLRDKMRRPGKQMMDAVTGSRRSSVVDLMPQDSAKDSAKAAKKVKDEGTEKTPEKSVHEAPQAPEPGSIPASPLAKKSAASPEVLPPSVTTERRKRVSSAMFKDLLNDDDDDEVKEESKESITLSDVDVYDFAPSSPHTNQQGKKRGARARSSRRYSTALEGEDDDFTPAERPASRRRSMMV